MVFDPPRDQSKSALFRVPTYRGVLFLGEFCGLLYFFSFFFT
jgi:hypothetical protein